MYLDLTEDPWTLTDHVISLSDYSEQTTALEVDSRRDPRIVCSRQNIPWFKSRRNKLPVASFPFRLHNEVVSFYYLPTSNSEKQDVRFNATLGVQDESYCIVQTNAEKRYTAETDTTSVSFHINNWINWCVRLFQEVVDKTDDSYGDEFAGLVRRSWETIMSQVTNNGEQEALMSLIVQLTGDQQLKRAMHSISRNPRKVLERIRQNMKVARIQQMDGACIREYARRPGLNTETKAGPKQELLALNRIENTDTLENRLYIWVLREIIKSAHKYQKENSSFLASERVQSVKKLSRDAQNMSLASVLKDVSIEGLIHPVTPNYPLQMDPRYKQIYNTYLKLRQNEKVYDDAWEWQRVLWACAARLIIYTHLQKIFKVPYSNFVYIKTEGIQGRWLNRADAPGPLTTSRKRIYLIDAWDIVDSAEWLDVPELFPGAHNIGRLGCDAIFYSATSKKVLLIWFAYGTTEDQLIQDERIESCQNALKLFIRDLKRQNKFLGCLDGLIITNVYDETSTATLRTAGKTGEPQTFLLTIPHRSYRHSEKIQEILKQITEKYAT